jgi:hypothetical protein
MSSRSDTGAFVVVRVFPDRFGAEVAKSALQAAGVESLIRADDAGGQQLAMWVGRGVDLLVRGGDLQRAGEILAAGDSAS